MSATAPDPPTQTRQHERIIERAREREEPTRIKTQRAKYARNLRGALRRIRAAIRVGITERDWFGLQREALVRRPGPRAFDFDRVDKQADEFEAWLERQTEAEIIEPYGGENQYIKRVYDRGVEDAHTELRALELREGSGIVAPAFDLPIHKRQVQALYSRNFAELDKLTTDIATDLRRELSEGLISGQNPNDIARDLVDSIGEVEDGTPRAAMNRATRIARTEVMNSHNRARAVSYERAGIEQVNIILAADACPICRSLKADAPFSVLRGKSLIPGETHPNCKCALVAEVSASGA